MNIIKKNIPNFLTISRGIGALIILILFLNKPNNWQLLIFIIFILASLTDFFDGWLARKWNIVSKFGKITDPLFDKILVFIMLFFLAKQEIIPTIIIWILFIRDLISTILSYYMFFYGHIQKTIMSAKIKTNFQILTIILMLIFMISPYYIILKKMAFISGIIAVIFSLFSFFHYLKNFFIFLKQSKINQTILSKK